MKNILVTAGSNRPESINRKLAHHAAKKIKDHSITEFRLDSLKIPIYNPTIEANEGIPLEINKWIKQISNSDLVIISLPEHNGSYSSVFKNAYDWASRVQYEVWAQKPMLLMATSPGERGGKSVLAAAAETFPRMGADLKATFSLPSFQNNFKQDRITDPDLEDQLNAAINLLSNDTSVS